MRRQARGTVGSRHRKEPYRRTAQTATLQYTVRAVPTQVDRALRRKAATERKSLNAILREALIREAGVAEPSDRLYTDLDSLAGTWLDDPGFDEAIRAQDQADPSLWR
jgi:plasmid stability protein